MKRLFLSILLLLPAFLVSAQEMKVTGLVRDENGDPLIGASVLITGSNQGVITDENGRYSILIDASTRILSFSYIGYVTQDIAVGGRYVINVDLLPDVTNALNEVVVIGYGTTKKADLTGSVATVKVQDIVQTPTSSIDQALQGRMAGVDIMNTSGKPGATTSIRIRGTRSINASNEPLIIVDGVLDAVHDIGEINAADVESISVMKDASSTAIYGSRGANGVILITTKKGVTSKPAVTVKAEYGVSMLARTLDTMNKDEFIRYLNDWYFFRSASQTSVPVFDPANYANDTNWIKEITRVAPYQNYNLSVSGKTGGAFTYFAALSYNDTRGIVDGSGMNRITARLNLNYEFNPKFSIGAKLSYTFRGEDLNKANIGGTSFWDGAVYLSPIIGPKDTTNPLYENGTSINTPRANIDMTVNRREMHTSTDVIELVYKPIAGLVIKSQNSYMSYQRHDYRFWPSYLPRRVEGEGSDAYRYEGNAIKWTTENTVTYGKKFRGDHKFDALLGYSASSNEMNYFSLKAEGLLTDDLTWNNMAGITSKENYTASTSSEKVVKLSAFARVNYNYKSRYYLTLTGRFDGSSNFAANNKWGFFPSMAFKWAVKQENFMKRAKWMDDLSLRLSIGRTGNDAIPYYRSLQAYSTYTNSYLFDGKQGASILPDRVANPNLTWEKTLLFNGAVDFTVLKGRLGVTFEAYHSRTNDLLLSLQTIQSTGFLSRLTNLGETTNTGVELTLEGKIFDTQFFYWTSQLTISHNKQMVVDIGQEDYVAVLNSPGNNSFMMYGYRAGYPLNSLWGFQYAGVWHKEEEFERNKYTRTYISNTTSNDPKAVLGYPRYIDQNHDGIMSDQDLIYLGNSDPVLYGGWQNTFGIGNFALGFFFTYSLGGKIYNYAELSMSGTYSANQYRYMLNAWHPIRNPESDLPRAGTEARMSPSSLQVHDATYLRLKSANLNYKFDFSRKSRFVRDLTIGVSATNLFLITEYNGFDPDVSTNSSEATLRRVDMGAYPQSRMVVLNAQIRF
ncbi:MAG: TonB-dependent receptor [Bacteroidales bacterium]|nr:TonB-dependent receptor [Bacteroidales bacterium]